MAARASYGPEHGVRKQLSNGEAQVGGQGQLSSRVWRPKTAIKWGRPRVWRTGPAKGQGFGGQKLDIKWGQAQGLASRAS
jgi:hypothetical protein